jgi:hypothetical protein
MQPQPDLLHPVPDRHYQIAGLAFGDAVHYRVIGIPLECHVGGHEKLPTGGHENAH